LFFGFKELENFSKAIKKTLFNYHSSACGVNCLGPAIHRSYFLGDSQVQPLSAQKRLFFGQWQIHFIFLTFEKKNSPMKTKRILIGTLVGGITMFFLGWLIYGVLLAAFMSENCTNTSARPEGEMIWWAMIASNLIWSLLLVNILEWTGRFTPGEGARTGAVLGLLSGLGFDLSIYSMSTMFNNTMIILVDSVCFSLLFAVMGLLAAWAMGKTGTEAVGQTPA
jgi:hypothetical protein